VRDERFGSVGHTDLGNLEPRTLNVCLAIE
jgi:hypothetical protein